MTDVTVPAAVWITISDTTLSETIFSIVPGNRFRLLVLIVNAMLVQGCWKSWPVEELRVMNP